MKEQEKLEQSLSTILRFWSEVHCKPMTILELSNALARGAKLVLSFITKRKYRNPKISNKINDHFTCTSANVIYCITCTYWNKLYVGETGRRLNDRFREHLRDKERNDKDASKPVARHFNLPIILNNIWQFAAVLYI